MIDRRKSMERLYGDLCCIYELIDSENEYGATVQSWEVVYENVRCKLSKKTLNDINQTDAEAISINSMVLFLDDRLAVKAGSKVECIGQFFNAGEPFVYAGSHQEIPLSTKEYA